MQFLGTIHCKEILAYGDDVCLPFDSARRRAEATPADTHTKNPGNHTIFRPGAASSLQDFKDLI
jgi:hypothetical protein